MTDTPIVYVVCQDDYEAHDPLALFTDPGIAEAHAETLRNHSGDHYEVRAMPLLDHAPTKVVIYTRTGFVYHDDWSIDDERTSTYETWEYYVPLEPAVSLGRTRFNVTSVHVAAATPEAAEAAFRDAVEKVRADANR